MHIYWENLFFRKYPLNCSQAFQFAFPMPGKKFAFSLTHVILYATLVALLSLSHHPAQDRVIETAIAEKKMLDKKKEKESSKKE